jgi:acyl-CoA synthetase (NDP forming)
MIKGRYETIIGFTRDPQFGPVIMFGMGGIYVELFRDVAMRIAPFTRLEAMDMIYETKIGKILMGYRGSRPVNIDMIVNTILRVMSLAVCIEDIVEMDINPLLVTDNAVFAIDVKVVVR